MSVLLPNGKHWLVSNWISRSLFEDALPYLEQYPSIAAPIQFAFEAELDTLDLSQKTSIEISDLFNLLNDILKRYFSNTKNDFKKEEDRAIYIHKLIELRKLTDDFLQTS